MIEPWWIEEARRQILEGIFYGHVAGGFTPKQADAIANTWDGVIKVSPVDTKKPKVPEITG